MKSKHVSETTTLPRRITAAGLAATPPRAIEANAAAKTKPTIIRVAAATPRIITTQPAIKPNPMPIALEEEEDLRPTFELIAPAEQKNIAPNSDALPVPPRARSPRGAADSAGESQSTSSRASGPRVVPTPPRSRASFVLRPGFIALIGATITAVTVASIVTEHMRAARAVSPARPIAHGSAPAPLRIELRPVAAIETNAARPVEAVPPVVRPEPSRDRGTSEAEPHAPIAPTARTMASSAPFAAARTARRLPSANDPNCLSRCHGSADCVVHCVRDDDPAALPVRSGTHALPEVHDAPPVEDVRLALARLGGEVADCSNGSLTGQATVDVTFASTGHVTTAIVRLPFAGTAIGSCIARVVRSAHVAPFTRRLLHVAYAYRIH